MIRLRLMTTGTPGTCTELLTCLEMKRAARCPIAARSALRTGAPLTPTRREPSSEKTSRANTPRSRAIPARATPAFGSSISSAVRPMSLTRPATVERASLS
jgi:hypothetical protein